MKTTKLVIGIVSIVLSLFTLMQSCAATLGDAMAAEGGTSGISGIVFTFLLLTAGIVGICTRKSRSGGITTSCFYFAGAIIALCMHGAYQDLIIWGALSIVFGIVFLYGSLKMPKKEKEIKEEKTEA